MSGGTGTARRAGGTAPPTVRIVTLGCAKNAVDAEVMEGLLAAGGFRVVAGGRADVGIVNTCGFIRDAKEESIEGILAMARAKARGRIGRLVVAGCLAKRYRDELPGLLPEVDLFVGPGDIPDLPGLLGKALAGGGPRARVGGGALPDDAYRHRAATTVGGSAWLKVLEGCGHGCAYCTIPSIRGPLASRDRGALLEEARMLVRRGAREIDLVGQDIASYGVDRGERGGLARLVRDLCGVRGLARLRLLYLHPGRIDDELIDLVATERKVCRYLDIPVQHADPAVLRRMGRGYGPGEILSLLARLRARVPGIFLRTSFIAGFPGETEAAFERLISFVREARWDYAGAFAYSREEGTRAYAMRPQVPEGVRQARAGRIREEQERILADRNAGMVGKTVEVLVEEVPARGRAVGRHEGQAPEVDGNVLLAGFDGPPGRLVKALVTGVRGIDLLAAMSGAAAADRRREGPKAVDTRSRPGILT